MQKIYIFNILYLQYLLILIFFNEKPGAGTLFWRFAIFCFVSINSTVLYCTVVITVGAYFANFEQQKVHFAQLELSRSEANAFHNSTSIYSNFILES